MVLSPTLPGRCSFATLCHVRGSLGNLLRRTKQVRYHRESSVPFRMIQLLVLAMQYYPLGLAMLGFIAFHLYEKFDSMGMIASSLVTAWGQEVASVITESQWNTVLFWCV
ncbi:unnamed protein product [Polarella glacialis]|uniref:Uncharacterized protein n=1 Tax=Polarella glacialis TaxID=89957 RepID=A0A813HA06_POLGL|nr:unnamed protein product [Polarella glacialis]